MQNKYKVCMIFSIVFQFMSLFCKPVQKNITDSNDSNWGPRYFREVLVSGIIKGISEEKRLLAAARWSLAEEGAKNAGRRVPILESINGSETAIIVIDMQRSFLDVGAAIEVPEGRSIIPNINKLVDALRSRNGFIVWFRYLVDEEVGLLKNFESKSYLGINRESPLKALQSVHEQFQLHPELHIEKTDKIMDKNRYSAVLGSSIVNTLRSNSIDNVIITGVTTDVCAGNTAEDLMQMDFNIIMVWDACAALDRLEHEIYLARIFGLYGDVMTTDEILERLR